MSTQLLETFPFIDYIVRSEGEHAFGELIEHLQGKRKASDILSLTWRDGSKVVENPARAMEDDLDLLPIPAFDAYEMSAGAPLYLDVGRGCPFKCTFCVDPSLGYRIKWRARSAELVVQEMKNLVEQYGIKFFWFSEDNFIPPSKRGRRRASDFSSRFSIVATHSRSSLALSRAGIITTTRSSSR
mgnify:CR=1 FL=1